MRRPSVFSRDYNRIMKRRRKILTVIYGIVFIAVGIFITKVSEIDFTELKNHLQIWVNDGTLVNEEQSDNYVESKEETTDTKINEENLMVTKIEEKYIDVNLEGITVKIPYIENGQNKTFQINDELKASYYIALSTKANEIILIDNNQNIYYANTDGKVLDLTLKQYVAPNGEIFEKQSVINTYNGYVWTKDAKFIEEGKIAYISNVPYFGYNLDQYITYVDINVGTHKTIWNAKGKEIKLSEIKEMGLEVSIDGNIMYITSNGQIKY